MHIIDLTDIFIYVWQKIHFQSSGLILHFIYHLFSLIPYFLLSINNTLLFSCWLRTLPLTKGLSCCSWSDNTTEESWMKRDNFAIVFKPQEFAGNSTAVNSTMYSCYPKKKTDIKPALWGWNCSLSCANYFLLRCVSRQGETQGQKRAGSATLDPRYIICWKFYGLHKTSLVFEGGGAFLSKCRVRQ